AQALKMVDRRGLVRQLGSRQVGQVNSDVITVYDVDVVDVGDRRECVEPVYHASVEREKRVETQAHKCRIEEITEEEAPESSADEKEIVEERVYCKTGREEEVRREEGAVEKNRRKQQSPTGQRKIPKAVAEDVAPWRPVVTGRVPNIARLRVTPVAGAPGVGSILVRPVARDVGAVFVRGRDRGPSF